MNPSDLLHIVDDVVILLAAIASAYAGWHAKQAHNAVNGGANSIQNDLQGIHTAIDAVIETLPTETPPKP